MLIPLVLYGLLFKKCVWQHYILQRKIKLLCQKTNNYCSTLICIKLRISNLFQTDLHTEPCSPFMLPTKPLAWPDIWSTMHELYILLYLLGWYFSLCCNLPNSNHCTASTCNALKSFIYSNIPHQISQILIRYNSDKNEYLHLMLLIVSQI